MFYVNNNNVGNMLSEYIYYKLTDKHRFNISPKLLSITDPETKEVITKILNYKIDKKINSKYSNLTAYKWRPNKNKKYEIFWKEARPIIREMYDNILTRPKDNDLPIIYFRCSDIPFIRYNMYHLSSISYINEIINELKQRNYNKVIFLNCSSHNTNNYDTCSDISDIYIELFENEGIEVIPSCGSIIGDFTKMVYCPFLVSLNSSSFSFMAGISKNPNNFMTNNIGYEKTQNGYTIYAPQVMSKIFNLNYICNLYQKCTKILVKKSIKNEK